MPYQFARTGVSVSQLQDGGDLSRLIWDKLLGDRVGPRLKSVTETGSSNANRGMNQLTSLSCQHHFGVFNNLFEISGSSQRCHQNKLVHLNKCLSLLTH